MQDLSGQGSVMGKALANGCQLAIDNINAAGGIDGRMIEMILYDVKITDPQEAINATKRLIDVDGVQVVIGSQSSNAGLALAPLSDELGVAQISVWGDPRIEINEDGSLNKYMFAAQPTAPQTGVLMGSYMYEKLGAKKFGVLLAQDNSYQVAQTDGLREYVDSMADKGVEIVAFEYCKQTDTDVKAQVAKLQASGAEALFVHGAPAMLAVATTQIYQAGMRLPITGSSDFQHPFGELVEPEVADNIYAFSNVNVDEPRLQDIRKQYVDRFGEEPTAKAYLGYDMVLIIAEAVRQNGGSIDPDDIRDAMENNIKDLEACTGSFTMSPELHAPVGIPLWIYKIEKGEYIPLEAFVSE